jgi:hypothetical protein
MDTKSDPTPKLRNYDDIVKEDPRKSPVFTTVINGKIVAWLRIHPMRVDKEVQWCAKLLCICNTCVSRARTLTRFCGPTGPSFFAGENFPTADESINGLRTFSKINCSVNDYILVLVKEDTFPATKYTGPGKTEVFSHWTITPADVTDPLLVSRMEGFWDDVNYSCRGRLAKFLTTGARRSIEYIEEIIVMRGTDATSEHPKYDLKRPEYWTGTLEWIRQILDKFPMNFDEMTSELKEELCVFAMATGHVSPDNKVHFNFRTSNNIVDFLVLSSKYDVAREMDKRSDPRTNQISAIAQAQAARLSKGVSGNSRWIALCWDGEKNCDDLDIKATFTFKGVQYVVYYGAKVAKHPDGLILATLDFDAGYMGEGKDKEPVENISVYDALSEVPIKIEVNNYKRMTFGSDVPFSVVISQEGREEVVIDLVWPKDRRSGDFLHVKTHTFHKVDEAEVALSESQARAAAAQDKEFKEIFGVPTSTVATVADLIEEGFTTHRLNVNSGSVVSCGGAASALHTFDQMVTSGLRPKADAKAKKYLADHLSEAPPGTVTDLCAAIESGKVSSVRVHLPDHVPGYVTKVKVDSSSAFMSGKPEVFTPC